MKLSLLATLVTSSALSLVACAPAADDGSAASASRQTVRDGKTDAQYAAEVTQNLQSTIAVDIDATIAALKDLQAAAPTPADRGWDRTADAAAIAMMRAAWIRARQAYERIEGVVAPIFPFIDVPLDDRYEGFLATLGQAGDQYLFDGHGVTGMHAIERILYVDVTPARVVQAESVIPGYKAAAMPATAQEAADFKNALCAKAISDANLLKSQWTQVQFEPSDALVGLTDLMIEQREKVNKAASNEEESRYSQRTMDDLQQNLAGTKRAYQPFSPWIASKPAPAAGGKSGAQVDAEIRAGFDKLNQAYSATGSPSIPQPPATWSDNPSAADLATPFGVLYTTVRAAVDPNGATSVVNGMDTASNLLGFPQN